MPYYDRFFLGGPDDLRGFEYRDVGPKDSLDEPIGGKTYGMFTAEYSIDVVKPVRFAIFYDAGFVNADGLRLQSRPNTTTTLASASACSWPARP